MKTKRIIAAVFAFAIAAANFSVTAFAAEEEIQTDVSTEAVSTETTVETTATDVTEVSEESSETTTETVEDENTDEDTTITKDNIQATIISGETFTIGDESFTASINGINLEIYNSKGSLAFSTSLVYYSDISIELSVNGNILTITQYDDCDRLENTASFEYNADTGLFGNEKDNSIYSNYTECDFEFAGKSLKAVRTSKRVASDVYYYLSIYFSDGTPTNIQNELVDCVEGQTTGYTRSVMSYIIIEDDTLTIRRIIDSQDSSKDILTAYVLDKDTNKLVKSGSTSDTQEVTEQMLLDKFTAQYGKPWTYESGDFNNDGVLDMYCSVFSNPARRYFVTMDEIVEVTNEKYDTLPWDGFKSYHYFSLSDGTQFSITREHHSPAVLENVRQAIHIDRIDKGLLSPVSIDGQEYVAVIDGYNLSSPIDVEDLNSIFSVNENGITLTYYDGATGSRKSVNYTYDAANNAFVSAGSTNNSGNSSTGSTNSVSSSPATSDNFSVIPFTLSIALVAGSAAAVGVKNRRKK